jgi:NAD(P)-dependent dehydrogenase (short-subunit alcohol dehydrogenase family)/aryl carrier-like protein
VASEAYTIAPARRADYIALLGDLAERNALPARIVHLLSLDDAPLGPSGEASAEAPQERGFLSVLFLTQALIELGIDGVQIVVVTGATQDVTGTETIQPARAMVTGPCRLIPLECPGLSCRLVDLAPSVGDVTAGQVTQLAAELACRTEDAVVALRGGRRWVQGFERLAPTAPQPAAVSLRPEGVYLITGGLGGVGLALAAHLGRRVRARLVLLGRSGLPPREEWSELLAAAGPEDAAASRIRQVIAIEKLGAEVLVIPADVTSAADMRRAMDAVLARFGGLDGVIHAAGVPGVGLMHLKTAESASRVLGPKVQGTLVLEQVLRERDQRLDFLVLCSSTASFTGGGPGQVDYCAANAFMDAYARRPSGRHRLTASVNWGEWRWSAWEFGLDGYDPAVRSFLVANREAFGMSFDEGCQAFERALGEGLPELVVSTQDFPSVMQISRSFTASAVLEFSRTQGTAKHPRPQLATSFVAPVTDLERRISAVWSDVLAVSDIGVHDNFLDLGGNSLVGLDLLARLRRELGVRSLPAHVLYAAPTVGELAQLLGDGGTVVGLAGLTERMERGALRRGNGGGAR